MRTLLLYVSALALLGVLYAGMTNPVHAQKMLCFAQDNIPEMAKKLGAKPTFIGRSGDVNFIILTNEKTGLWFAMRVDAKKMACLLVEGQSFSIAEAGDPT